MKAAAKVECLLKQFTWMGIGSDGGLYKTFCKDLGKFGIKITSERPSVNVIQIDLIYKHEHLRIRYHTKKEVRTILLEREHNFVFFFNTPGVKIVDTDFDYRYGFDTWINNIMSVFKDERPWYSRVFTY